MATIKCKKIQDEYEITIEGSLVEVTERYFWGTNPNHNYRGLMFSFEKKMITYCAEWWHGGSLKGFKHGLYHINQAKNPKFNIEIKKKEKEILYISDRTFYEESESDQILLEILKSSGLSPKNIVPKKEKIKQPEEILYIIEEVTRPKNCHKRTKPFMPDWK